MKAFLTALPCLGILYVSPCLGANSVVVDSFTEGSIGAESPINSLLATSRIVILGPRFTPAVDTLLVSPNTNLGSLTFYSHDTTPDVPWRNLYIQVTYINKAGLFDASLYNAFAFGFTDLVGTGDLVIEIGYGPNFYNEATISTPITEPGWLEVPMEAINYSTRGNNTLNAFSSIHFTFRAASPTFGFTLDEIALTAVPEPSSAAALLGGFALFLASAGRRRRGQPPR